MNDDLRSQIEAIFADTVNILDGDIHRLLVRTYRLIAELHEAMAEPDTLCARAITVMITGLLHDAVKLEKILVDEAARS